MTSKRQRTRQTAKDDGEYKMLMGKHLKAWTLNGEGEELKSDEKAVNGKEEMIKVDAESVKGNKSWLKVPHMPLMAIGRC